MANIEMNTISSSPSPSLTQAQITALEPLEDSIGYLGAARTTLEGLRQAHSMKHFKHDTNPRTGDGYFKRGTEQYHRTKAKFMRDGRNMHVAANSGVPVAAIASAHEAIANRIKAVKEAHVALSRTHPTLAWKDGKTFSKNRKYKTPSGATQSLGNYHGKKVTEDGIPKTFKKGGRKTKKHRRKRKTHKHKTRKRKRKRKTKRRKHKRKTHKRKTQKHRR